MVGGGGGCDVIFNITKGGLELIFFVLEGGTVPPDNYCTVPKYDKGLVFCDFMGSIPFGAA